MQIDLRVSEVAAEEPDSGEGKETDSELLDRVRLPPSIANALPIRFAVIAIRQE